MKRFLLYSAALSAMLGISQSAMAYDFAVDGIYYNKIAGANKLSVTYKDTKYASYSGDVVIPSTVTYDGVTYTVTELGKYSIRNSAELTSITLPETLEAIQMGSFSKCDKLTKLVIPNSVTTIGNLAIQDNPNLAELILGTGIETIGTGAFMGDVALTNVVLPPKLTAIQSNVFANCTSLKTFNIPAGITTVNGGAFQGCIQLTDFTVDASNANYTAIEGVLYSKDKTMLAVYPGGRTATGYTVPEGVEELGFLAFGQRNISVSGHEFYDTSLKNVSLPSTLLKLGNSSLQNLTAMESITLPENLNWIGNATFRGCTSLTEITVPDKVTTLDSYAFQSCTSLTEVTLGKGVTAINASVFKGDAALKKFVCNATVPPVCKSTSFDATVSNAELIVPAGTVDAYKAAEGWKLFGKISEASGAGVNEIEFAMPNVVEILNIHGISIQTLEKGINIVRMNDGSVRKIMK